MLITLNQIYSWKVRDGASAFPYPYEFLDGLKVLSLDVCTPFYRNLLLPLSFESDCKEALQRVLSSYNRRFLQSDQDNEKYLLFAFNELESKIGLAKTLDIGEWLGASVYNHEATKNFEECLGYIVKNISKGHIKDKIPLRIERYVALSELLIDTIGYEWDAQLEPSKLKSSWDRKIYAAQVSTDPDDQYNYWDPSASAYLRSCCMCTRISLENAMRNPSPDVHEISELNSWINGYCSHLLKTGETKESFDISDVLLRPRLKQEYLNQKLILY